jgi:hypothetical protein
MVYVCFCVLCLALNNSATFTMKFVCVKNKKRRGEGKAGKEGGG